MTITERSIAIGAVFLQCSFSLHSISYDYIWIRADDAYFVGEIYIL